MTTYLDANATSAVDPRVVDVVVHHLVDEFGNAGSRTHEFGVRAARAVESARTEVAQAVGARPDEVLFTSGATEANNMAILGIAPHALASGRSHVIVTAVEHKAVLEPATYLGKQGFEVSVLPVDERGWPEPNVLQEALRDDTVLVSTMHVNNETGVELPLDAYAKVLAEHGAWWHVDAAQGFGKATQALTNERVDLISISGHKLYAPMGVGALVARRRGYDRPPLQPLMFGGGQERGLRPGTVPVPLVAGLGEAARLSLVEGDQWVERCSEFRSRVLDALSPFNPRYNGDQDRVLPHVLNVSLPGVDAEAVMVALKGVVAISNGSACTSKSYEPSHVLTGMGLSDDRVHSALRLSWSHLTPEVDWEAFQRRLSTLTR